jgi:hypothetical protein
MNQIYREKVFSGLLTILPGAMGVALLGASIFTRLSGTFDDASIPWYFLGVGLFLLVTAINFSYLNISISSTGISTRFGIISHNVPLNNIGGCSRDTTSNFSYGGFGIRLAWVDGKRRLVYNVFSAPRIVIRQRNESNHEFVFSTRNPEGVMKALKELAADN